MTGSACSAVILGMLLAPAHAADRSPPAEVLLVDDAIAVAVRDNPDLAQTRSRYEALEAVPSQVGTLPDPTVSFGAMNFPTDTFRRSQEPMTQLQFGIRQEIPFPGKLGLRQEAAEFDAIAAARTVDEARLQLVRSVRTKWWETLYLDRALETVASNQDLLRQFVTVATTKYETGAGLQQDVLLAQLELSRLLEQEIRLVAMRQTQAIHLNILMDRLPEAPVRLPETVSKAMGDLPPPGVLYEIAVEKRPLLATMQSRIEAARSRLELAEREFYPDFGVAVTYGERAGDNPPFMGGARADVLSLMLSARIPLYAGRKQSKGVAQRSSELRADEYALHDQLAQVREQIAGAVTDYEEARQRHRLYGTGIIPQARQTVESMLGGYQVGEVDFLNLVRSQITLLNYELEYWKSLVEAKAALARLAASVGEDALYE
ncbi:MAG: TolC family protein [Gammaproteobacteria bacterium]